MPTAAAHAEENKLSAAFAGGVGGIFAEKAGKMHRRVMLRASRNNCTVLNCTHFCAELIRGCTVLTKFLICLNKRGGFYRRVFALSVCMLIENAAFAAAKSQMIASCLSFKPPFLHHRRMQSCKKCARSARERSKTNNEALHYANCKMSAKAILQVFKMRLQNAKYCATFTKYKICFCEKQLIFSSE